LADASSDWVRAKLDLANISEPDYVDMAFMGDIMLDRGVKTSVLKNFNGDYSALFDKMDILQKKDIVFANLEGPASDKGADLHNLYSFRMDPSVIPALKGAGYTILSVANNHVGDWGRIAYIDTLSRLKENELLYAGGGINTAEAESPTIIEKNGMKIGFLGFSDKGPEDLAVAEDKTGLLLANNPRFDEIIKKRFKTSRLSGSIFPLRRRIPNNS
jgi:poly-gamma-glutamate capsule biosynthesis protein CapA/YwtB (metallophosphatase superfamily)